jgi:hypothetical protein
MNLNIRGATLSVLRASFAIFTVKGFKPPTGEHKKQNPFPQEGVFIH